MMVEHMNKRQKVKKWFGLACNLILRPKKIVEFFSEAQFVYNHLISSFDVGDTLTVTHDNTCKEFIVMYNGDDRISWKRLIEEYKRLERQVEMKRLHEVFEDSEHEMMIKQKQKLAEENGRKSIGWREYILHVTGVRKIGN